MAGEGEWPKVDGDILYGSEVNTFHNSKVQEVYVGTGFNSAGTEASVELTAVTGAIANTADYVKVSITGTAFNEKLNGQSAATVQLKAQIKETGGSYADIVAYATVSSINLSGSSSDVSLISSFTYSVIYELTAGMKTNGFQIKPFASATGTGSPTFTNIQTVVELA